MEKTFMYRGFEIVENGDNSVFSVSLVSPLDGYMIDELPSSDWATKDERLGWKTVDDGLIGAVPDYLVNYLDYEAIGRDRRIRESGCYISRGDTTYYVVA